MKDPGLARSIEFGEKDLLPPNEFDPSNSKVSVSVILDGDVLEALKRHAGKGLENINAVLRTALKSNNAGRFDGASPWFCLMFGVAAWGVVSILSWCWSKI